MTSTGIDSGSSGNSMHLWLKCGHMAEKIVVSVVDASGIRSAHTFRPPKIYQAVTGVLEKAFGVGCLVNGQGDIVTPDNPVAAGPYTYTVTGRPGVGEATLTRNLASQTGEIQVVLHEAAVRSTAHFEEMKQEMKLEMKREMERQMKRLQAQLLEGTKKKKKTTPAWSRRALRKELPPGARPAPTTYPG
ncbi:hypothetical protein QJQ45_012811 [Haematococcus lacustris]|nr:hypothetical protein QJQ45_012811 [Haematococcus lacustris]